MHRSPVCCSGRPRCWMPWDELSPNLLQTSGKPGTTAVAALYHSALLDVWPGGGCMPLGGSKGDGSAGVGRDKTSLRVRGLRSTSGSSWPAGRLCSCFSFPLGTVFLEVSRYLFTAMAERFTTLGFCRIRLLLMSSSLLPSPPSPSAWWEKGRQCTHTEGNRQSWSPACSHPVG